MKKLSPLIVVITLIVVYLPIGTLDINKRSIFKDPSTITSHDSKALVDNSVHPTKYGSMSTSSLNGECQWYSGGPSHNESITSVAVDSSNADILYASNSYGGLNKSIDGGKNWELIDWAA